jgi:hypothetical protein
MAKIERKRFVTTINPEILTNFKVTCVRQNKDMNEILELLMSAYSDGVISIKEIITSDDE